jgi:hypothetical protein
MPNLVFTDPPLAGSPTPLVFGARDEVELVYEAQIVAVLPGLKLRATLLGTQLITQDGAIPEALHAEVILRQMRLASLNGIIPEQLSTHMETLSIEAATILGAISDNLGSMMELLYLSNTQRPVVAQATDSAQVAHSSQFGIEHKWQNTGRSRYGFQTRFTNATAVQAVATAEFQDCKRLLDTISPAFAEGVVAGRATRANWQEASQDCREFEHSRFQEGWRAQTQKLTGVFQDGLRDRRAWVNTLTQAATNISRSTVTRGGYGKPTVHTARDRFRQAWVPRPGVHVILVTPPVDPTYWGPALLFACPPLAIPMLVFGARQCELPPIPPTGVVTVAVRRVYFVINDVSLRRASNGVDVPVASFSLSLDASSWTWGFDALLPHSAQGLIEPNGSGVVELLATVNGTTFAVLAENISRERSFGQTSIRLTGRGKNAVLAAPYAPVMTFTNSQVRTARQLMDDVLTINGVPLGWSVDWGLTDWSVSAGVFAHQGTWIEALSVIAGAAGGYLLPHPRDQTIRVRRRYPVAPWEWGTVTPNFVLPVDAVEKESLRWLEKPSYNRVFVSGQEAGVLAQVTRSGTAGDLLAPMVVDALITEAAVARQRGLAVLSDTGRQIEVSLHLPVMVETGIIEPGAIVQYRDAGVDRIGLVRSTQVQAGFPEVWQSLGVQTYA